MRTSLLSIFIICKFLADVSASKATTHVRRAQDNVESECRVYMKLLHFEDGSEKKDYDCAPSNSPDVLLAINLSDEFIAQNEIISGDTVLHYPSSSVSVSSGELQLNEDEVTVLQDPRASVSNGNKSILALRIIATDSSTSASEVTISDEVFGTSGDVFNLKSGYDQCSYGQLTFEEYVGTTSTGKVITNGVTTITLQNFNVGGKESYVVVNEITSVANTVLGSLQSQFDHVMYCLPSGTNGSWIAYAYINHWLSVYNDEWCNYPSGQMHEIGHNLNLAHSGEGATYDDQTGMMGYSYSSDEGPVMCFNAPKNAQLGWYDDKLEVFDSTTSSSWIGKILGISDYENAAGDDIVILRIIAATFDYYVSFNRKAGINAGTAEAGNKVLIHRRENGFGYKESKLLSKLDAGNTYVIGEIEITVNELSISTNPGYAIVTVTNGSATISPTKSPTSSPTQSPTSSPTKSPTLSPAKIPTASPNSPTVAVYIKNFDVISKVRKNMKVKSIMWFSIRTSENDRVEGAVIEIAFPWGSNDEKVKECITKANGKCSIKLPAYDPTEVPTVDVGLKAISTDVGSYDENLNVGYKSSCPVFSENCKFITIDNTEV